MPKIKIVVDPDLCIGAASCVTISPDTFQLNEENKAVVLDKGQGQEENRYERVVEVSGEELEQLIMSAQSCPTLAISIFDVEGKKLFPEG